MDINEIISEDRPIAQIIADLKDKTTPVPLWEELEEYYDPKKHEIITNPALRPRDKRKKNGQIDRAARILYPAEKIVTRRMNQMCFTIPVERKYETEDDETLKEIANAIEAIYEKVRINGVNKNRMRAYFGACEVCTVWYAVEEENEDYGFKCKYKFKCRSYSPIPTKMSKISEAKLWPVFDEYDDMVAMCIEYTITKKKQTTYYFDCYTKDTFKSYSSKNGLYTDAEIETRPIPIGKIPAVYLWRPAPIYDGIANNRSDIELTLSRTSDVIRKNSAPIVKVVGDLIGDKPDGGEAREVYKLKQGGDVGLVSPAVSHDAIQYYISQLKENIEEDTQMPNLSMTNVKSLGNIGADARKTLLADAHMKVGEEKDDIIWAFDRECNIIKAFLAEAKNEWRDGIKRLKVSHHITPFVQNDRAARISELTEATGGKPVMSQQTAVERLGEVKDVDAEMKRLKEEQQAETESSRVVDVFEGAR